MSYQQPPAPAPWPSQHYGPPPKKKHTLRNVLIVVAVVLVLMVGGCVALVGTAANEVSKSIATQDAEVGGTSNPLTIKKGKAFEVRGFQYAAGWTLKNDVLDDVDVSGLKVTNKRGKRDAAIVEIKIWKGTEVVALADCTTEEILPNTTTKMNCSSADQLPKKYTKITINDSF